MQKRKLFIKPLYNIYKFNKLVYMSSKLTNSEIFKNKEEFISLLSKVNRPGIDSLISWLDEKSDFFTAPSSSCYHGAYEGGLCQHSLNVYHALKNAIEMTKTLALPEKQLDNISEETIILVALLHDLCKTNFYQKEIKVFKDDATNTWHHYYQYKCVDNFPVGHGEKSVIMAQNFIKLTCTEILAIRWHMGTSDPGVTISTFEKPSYGKAINICPLVVLLSNADNYASFLMEYEFNPKVDNLID